MKRKPKKNWVLNLINTAICVICLLVWKYIENKTAKEGFFSSSRQLQKMFGAWINHCNL